MPYISKEPQRPQSWRQYRKKHRSKIFLPFLFIDWLGSWAAWFLGRSVLLEVLEYCGTLSILVGVIFYFAGAKDRLEQKHYQAWQVINTAQGKGGSGGRIDALEDLNSDGVALTGVDLRDAFLRNVKLPNASLDRSSLGGSDMRGADLSNANLEEANLVFTNLEAADLRNARCPDANFKDADLSGATLSGADLARVDFTAADLRHTDLAGINNWESISSITLANIFGCQHAPENFRHWALAHGAVEIESDAQWNDKVNAMDTTRTAK